MRANDQSNSKSNAIRTWKGANHKDRIELNFKLALIKCRSDMETEGSESFAAGRLRRMEYGESWSHAIAHLFSFTRP